MHDYLKKNKSKTKLVDNGGNGQNSGVPSQDRKKLKGVSKNYSNSETCQDLPIVSQPMASNSQVPPVRPPQPSLNDGSQKRSTDKRKSSNLSGASGDKSGGKSLKLGLSRKMSPSAAASSVIPSQPKSSAVTKDILTASSHTETPVRTHKSVSKAQCSEPNLLNESLEMDSCKSTVSDAHSQILIADQYGNYSSINFNDVIEEKESKIRELETNVNHYKRLASSKDGGNTEVLAILLDIKKDLKGLDQRVGKIDERVGKNNERVERIESALQQSKLRTSRARVTCWLDKHFDKCDTYASSSDT